MVSIFIQVKVKYIILLIASLVASGLSAEDGGSYTDPYVSGRMDCPAGTYYHSSSESLQSDNVTGKVTDEKGEPLVGVMVYIKGTATGVSTDLDGNYSIKAPGEGESYTLVYQYIGTVTREIVVSKQRRINVTLVNDNHLDEAVIIGAYGTKQSREDLVGSAYQVNAEAIKNKPKARIDNILEGLVPGVRVNLNTDDVESPRARYETRIRGGASLGSSNEPLWVIDGVPYYTGGRTNLMSGVSYTVSPLSYLDPNNIESITVLKDADQVTIYGANGANGVILVTTKSGYENTPLSVSATVEFGVSAPDRSTMFKMMDASQYMEVAREAWTNAGYSIGTFPYQDNEYNSYSTTATDWTDEYMGLGSSVYASLVLRNGTKKSSSYVSGSYYREASTIKSDISQRYTLDAKNTYSFTDWLRFDTKLSASLNDNDMFFLTRDYNEVLPIFEPYMPDGSYRIYNMIYDSISGWTLSKFYDNQVPDRDNNVNDQRSVVTTADFSLNADIIKGLTATAQYNIKYQHTHEDRYESIQTPSGIDSDGEPDGESRKGDASYLTWTAIGRLNFDRNFGKHRVGGLAGIELHQQRNKYLSGSVGGILNDNWQELGFGDEETESASSGYDIQRSMSFFFRGTYSYDSRYYFTLNYRREGNSDFGEYSKWADFWSVGASWNIHNEKFFHSEKINMLKAKVSYGTSGNSRVGSSSVLGTYNYGNSYRYGGSVGAVIGTVPNPGLTWESTAMMNAGIRIEFLEGRIAAELEYYYNYTSNMISRIYVSRTISSDRVYANIGELSNRGIELNIESDNIRAGQFNWHTSFNISHNRNIIEKLYNGVSTRFSDYTIWMEGYDRDTYYLVDWAGVDPSDGSPMWYDIDGNLTKTYNSNNRKPGKSASPILTGGIINTFTYRNWALSFQINYDIGGYALPSYARFYFRDGLNIIDGNQAVEVYYDRWKAPGQRASFPKVSQTSTDSWQGSTRFLYDKTNFELSTVSLSYSLPKRISDDWGLSSATVSLVCNNAYLFTPDQKRGRNSYKTMKSGYPVTRVLSLNFNISF